MRDIGKVMGILKSKNADTLDFSKSKFNYKRSIKINEISKKRIP